MDPASIPEELRARPQWVGWQGGPRGKVPCDLTGRPVDVTDPRSWSTFDTVWTECEVVGNQELDGIGYCFSEDDEFAGIDLDSCVDLGEIVDWSPKQQQAWPVKLESPLEILRGLDSYAEYSPSGTGVKVFVRGSIPHGLKRGDFEMYSSGRFFTVTGAALNGSTIRPAQEQLQRYWALLSSECKRADLSDYEPSGNSEEQLDQIVAFMSTTDSIYRGDRDYPSASEFDLALWGRIAEFTGPHPDDIMHVARQSDHVRPKWDRQDYVNRTLGRILASFPEQEIEPSKEILSLPDELKQDDEILKLLDVPGFLNDYQDHYRATALYPLPVAGLFGGLAMLAVLTGRRFRDPLGNTSNVMLTTLAATGSGKNHARQMNYHLANEAHAGQLMGSEQPRSDAAVFAALSRQPVQMMQIDEFGRVMSQAARSTSIEFGVINALMKCFSSHSSTFSAMAYRDQSATVTVDRPCLVLHSTSTEEAFWGSMDRGSVVDGFVPRLLVWSSPRVHPNRQAFAQDVALPADLVEQAMKFSMLDLFIGSDATIILPWEPGVVDLVADATIKYNQMDHPIWTRVAEKAGKLALLHCLSRGFGDVEYLSHGIGAIITTKDIEWGLALADIITRQMARKMREHMADSVFEAKCQAVLRNLNNEPDRAAKKTRFNRLAAVRRLPPREREEVLQALVEQGHLCVHKVSTEDARKPTMVVSTAGRSAEWIANWLRKSKGNHEDHEPRDT